MIGENGASFGDEAPKDGTPDRAPKDGTPGFAMKGGALAARLPPGWHLTPEGAWARDCKPRMTRRKRDWDYKAPGIYLITLVLADRKSRALGKIVVDLTDAQGMPLAAHCELSPMGAAVAAEWEGIPRYYPQVRIIGKQVMPDHFHGLIWVQEPIPCHLGQIINGFISGCRCVGVHFASGYNDKPLMGRGQLDAEMKYLKANPLRLAIKAACPELFKVRRDIVVKGMHFEAIGNDFLLQRPMHQVQCSRRFFAYAREKGAIARDAHGEPIEAMHTAEYEVRREAMEAAAEQGAVIISPCISEGERQLARHAHQVGYPVIALRNMGFPEIYKPGGRAFERCADGKLLLLAPIAWPHQNTPRPMTRTDACALNRIAQLLAGEGAAEIDYKGMRPAHIDALVAEATRAR